MMLCLCLCFRNVLGSAKSQSSVLGGCVFGVRLVMRCIWTAVVRRLSVKTLDKDHRCICDGFKTFSRMCLVILAPRHYRHHAVNSVVIE